MLANLFAGLVALTTPIPEPITYEQALTICREVYLGDRERASSLFAPLPEDEKRFVSIVCTGYARGLRDGRDAKQHH